MSKQSIWKILTILLVAFVSINILSCEDNKDEADTGLLIGSWSCDNHYIDRVSFAKGTDTYTFRSDGTFEWQCRGWESKSGNYLYNKEKSTLSISDQKGTTWVYIIVSLADSFFVMLDEDGYSYTYYRK